MHSPIKSNVLQHKINTKKLKPSSVAFYDIWPGNGAGLFSKEKTSTGGDKEKEKKDKWRTIRYKQGNNVYIAPKSKIESRVPYAQEPARGNYQYGLFIQRQSSIPEQTRPNVE